MKKFFIVLFCTSNLLTSMEVLAKSEPTPVKCESESSLPFKKMMKKEKENGDITYHSNGESLQLFPSSDYETPTLMSLKKGQKTYKTKYLGGSIEFGDAYSIDNKVENYYLLEEFYEFNFGLFVFRLQNGVFQKILEVTVEDANDENDMAIPYTYKVIKNNGKSYFQTQSKKNSKCYILK